MAQTSIPDSTIDLSEQIARIDRAQAETRKFVSEMNKLSAEASKLSAEQLKLMAEAMKLDKERWWFPWLQLVTVSVSSAVIAAIVARLL